MQMGVLTQIVRSCEKHLLYLFLLNLWFCTILSGVWYFKGNERFPTNDDFICSLSLFVQNYITWQTSVRARTIDSGNKIVYKISYHRGKMTLNKYDFPTHWVF